jgi:uncharacterized protein (TIRG00374 family)
MEKDMKLLTRQWLLHTVAVLFGLGIIGVWLLQIDLGQAWDSVRKSSPGFVALAILAYAFTWVFRTWRLACITKQAKQQIGFYQLFKLHIAAYALNVLFPAKLGDVAMIFFLRTKQLLLGQAAAMVLQTRLLDVAALVCLVFPVFIVLAGQGIPTWVGSMVVAALIVLGVVVSLVVLDRKQRLLSLLETFYVNTSIWFLKKVWEKIAQAYKTYHELILDRKTLLTTILLSLCVWSIESVATYCLALALGLTLSWVSILITVALANLAKCVPITPGGLGIYESTFVAVFVFLGMPLESTVVLALLDPLLKKTFNVVIGLPIAYALGLDIKAIYQSKVV